MFGLEMLEKGYDLNAPEGKTEFLREAARRLARFEEEIERDNYIEAVAKTYHVGYEELKKLVVKVAVQSGMGSSGHKAETDDPPGNAKRGWSYPVTEDSAYLADRQGRAV